LWVNLIMDTLAALALATEMPTDALLERRPFDRKTYLISPAMWRFVFVHSFFQLIICLVLLFFGEKWLGLEGDENFKEGSNGELENRRLKCMIFNSFVWMQIFNEINARKVNGEWNVIENFFDNWMFSAILALTSVLQFVIVEFGQDWASTISLNFQQWAFCVVIGTVSFPIAQICLWFPADLEHGMVEVEESWFRVDKEFKEGKKTASSTTMSHTNMA